MVHLLGENVYGYIIYSNGGQSLLKVPLGFHLMETSFFWVVTISNIGLEHLLTLHGGGILELCFSKDEEAVRRLSEPP